MLSAFESWAVSGVLQLALRVSRSGSWAVNPSLKDMVA